MNIKDRQLEIIRILQDRTSPISGGSLAEKFGLSRQVIVKDISILKASGYQIKSNNKGYWLSQSSKIQFIIKCSHRDEEIGDELNIIVDRGGEILDVFVNHKTYGLIKKELNIKSRKGVDVFIKSIDEATPLKNLTENIHYHTVRVDNEFAKESIENKLREQGILIDKAF